MNSGEKNQPIITIVTPSLNQGAFIEETLRSVLDQDYPRVESIVIDGGSTDNSPAIIRGHQDQIAYWTSEPDRGQADAINKGLNQCTGDIVGYLNSDDLLIPNSLRTIADVFANHPDALWMCGVSQVFESTTGNTAYDVTPDAPAERAKWVVHEYRMQQPSCFWRRELFDQIGYFDPTLHYCFDHEFFLRAKMAGYSPLVIPDLLSRARLHEASKTCSAAGWFVVESEAICRRYWGRLNRDERHSVRHIRREKLKQALPVSRRMHKERSQRRLEEGRWRLALADQVRAYRAKWRLRTYQLGWGIARRLGRWAPVV